VQWAGIAALDVDMQAHIDAYRRKRDMLYEGLKDCYELVRPGGAFYAFPRAPGGMTGTDFVTRAIEQGLLIIPGNIFSRRDTHFRLSYAASDQTIQRGVEVLRRLARNA
jgi:aspartate aminotransferase/aminotransferase